MVVDVSDAASTGDFNQDNTVDAADYVAWRNGLGTTYSPYDYELWRYHYGEMNGPTTAAPAAPAIPPTIAQPPRSSVSAPGRRRTIPTMRAPGRSWRLDRHSFVTCAGDRPMMD